MPMQPRSNSGHMVPYSPFDAGRHTPSTSQIPPPPEFISNYPRYVPSLPPASHITSLAPDHRSRRTGNEFASTTPSSSSNTPTSQNAYFSEVSPAASPIYVPQLQGRAHSSTPHYGTGSSSNATPRRNVETPVKKRTLNNDSDGEQQVIPAAKRRQDEDKDEDESTKKRN